MRFAIVSMCVAVLASCGLPVDEGKYDVTLRLERDTCGVGFDDVSEAVWEIKENDGDWKIDVEDGDVFDGEEKDGTIEFSGYDSNYDSASDCTQNLTTTISIEPDDDGFSGDVKLISDVDCSDGSSDTCLVRFGVTGEPH